MTTKKWIGAVVAIGMSASLAVAAETVQGTEGHGWGGHGHHSRHGVFGEKLANKLNLTDAQKAELKASKTTFREQNKAFFEQSRQTRKDFHIAKKAGDTAKMDALKPVLETQRAQMKELRVTQEQAFISILTPDQKAQFDTMKAQRAARRAARAEQK